MDQVEIHPLRPFLPENARLLMLGSFPPPRSKWKMDFYYPNFQNDMWRIMGLVFFQDKDYFLTDDKKMFDREAIIQFLNKEGIALFDTAREVIRGKSNAADQFLKIVAPNDIAAILAKILSCRIIVTTGEKATQALLDQFAAKIKKPSIGNFIEIPINGKVYRFYRMPSSSRAYPKSLADKAAIYSKMFSDEGFIRI